MICERCYDEEGDCGWCATDEKPVGPECNNSDHLLFWVCGRCLSKINRIGNWVDALPLPEKPVQSSGFRV